MYSQLVNHYNQIDIDAWTWNIELELINDLIKITEMANQIRVGGVSAQKKTSSSGVKHQF